MKLLNYKQVIFLFFFIMFLKVYIFVFILNFTSIGGADANYYDAYATGIVTNAVNIWPEILYQLNELGMYDREIIKYILFIISSLIIPILIVNILSMNKMIKDKKMYWNLALIVSLYPVLFYFSIDIYRDIIMALLFLITLYLFKVYTLSSRLTSYFIYVLVFFMGFILFFWRPYLGFSILIALVIYKIFSIKQLKNLPLIIGGYLFVLLFSYQFGILDSILTYRGENGFEVGGISMGIGMIGKNPIEFLALFLYSGLMQLFGLYIVNLGALFLFVFESIPFAMGCWYIFKNRVYIGEFEKFVLLFCLIYATIWIIGNDNLGTAVRLRIYNYLGVMLVAGFIYLKKKAHKSEVST